MSTLGKRLKEARLTHQPKKLTQKEVAVRAGISQTTIADIERGRNDGSKYLAELAGAVNCSLTWLATDRGEMRPREGSIGEIPGTRTNQADVSPALTPERQQILSVMEGISPEARDALLKAVSLLSGAAGRSAHKPQARRGVKEEPAPIESEYIETGTYKGPGRRRLHFGIPDMKRLPKKAQIALKREKK